MTAQTQPVAVCPTCGETFWELPGDECPWDGTPIFVDEESSTRVDRVVGGRYRVLDLLGEGAMGQVYVGEHVLSLERVALKILRPELQGNPKARARFLLECRTLQEVQSPHVVAVLEAGVSKLGELHLVTERLVGETLGARMTHGEPLTVQEALSIATRVCDALTTVHARGIVHRDLKPENIFLCEDGSLRVLDFGIARLLDGRSDLQGGHRKLTALGSIVGTPAYISPEGAAGGQVGAPADLYSLGVVLYEMLAGELPFWHETPIQMLGMHLKKPAPRLDAKNPDLPPELVELVAQLLQKAPESRPSTAAAVLSILGGSGTQGAGAPSRHEESDTVEDTPSRGAPLWLVAAAGITTLLMFGLSAAAGLYWALHRS